jgi:hypothetical protein
LSYSAVDNAPVSRLSQQTTPFSAHLFDPVKRQP